MLRAVIKNIPRPTHFNELGIGDFFSLDAGSCVWIKTGETAGMILDDNRPTKFNSFDRVTKLKCDQEVEFTYCDN